MLIFPNGSLSVPGRNIQQLLYLDTLKHYRAVQAVFQYPYSSLSPWMIVGRISSEPLRIIVIVINTFRFPASESTGRVIKVTI